MVDIVYNLTCCDEFGGAMIKSSQALNGGQIGLPGTVLKTLEGHEFSESDSHVGHKASPYQVLEKILKPNENTEIGPRRGSTHRIINDN